MEAESSANNFQICYDKIDNNACDTTWVNVPGNSFSALSLEINTHYARLFHFFQKRPELCGEPIFQRAIRNHLPRILADEYSDRIKNLPAKYQYAILAAEIASSLVYCGDREADFEEMLRGHLVRILGSQAAAAATLPA